MRAGFQEGEWVSASERKTLTWPACVHFPHHCPCAWPNHQEKFELGEGSRICVSKGGFKAGEAARKVELARKNLL